MKSPFRFALMAMLTCVALYACGSGSSSASSGGGLTQAQVQALINTAITPLQQQIATLQSEVASASPAPAVFIHAPNAPAVAVKAQLRDKTSAAPTCTGLGTLTGRPSDSDPFTTNLLSGVSCSGYYFTVSGAATSAETSTVQPAPAAIKVWFDGPNCSGNAYVQGPTAPWGVTATILANGAVLTTGDPTQSASYWMLKPGTVAASANLQSVLQGGTCSSYVTAIPVYALVPNDQSVSGVPSAPIPGPVTIG